VAVLAVVSVLGGCGQAPGAGAPSKTNPAPQASPASQSSTAPSSSTGPGPSATSTAPAPNSRTITVTVRGRQVSGDTGRVQVPLGAQVTLTVSSDVADEVHLHGYDKEADVPAGGSASISFAADIPGVFEVELHKSELQLLQLQVS
jgi:hypothetical protein